MTDQELHDAIAADPQAASLADVGDDSGCAARMSAILPPEVFVGGKTTDRGIFDAFADPADAEAVMQGLEAVATGFPTATPPIPGNPVVRRALGWLTPAQGGLDLGNPKVRSMLDQLRSAGALTVAAVTTLKALAERPASVSADDVSQAWLSRRPEGKVNN